MERKATIILLVVVVALIVGGCKRERINPFDPGNPNARVVYAPQTKIPSENPQLVKDTLIGDKVYLTYEEGATLPEFEEGDILIGLRGEGYLRKVKSCTVQGNQVIVETEQATIKEAFTRLMIDTTVDIVIPEKKIKLGKIDYHTKTKGYNIYVQSDPGSYGVKDGTMRFEWPNFVIEIRSGGNLAASFKAERVVLWSNLDLNFYYDFSLIDGLHLLTSMLHEDSLNFVNATLYMYTEIPLLSAEIPLVPPIGVPIPLGPIVVTPEVGINADLQSMLQVTQSIFAQADANFYAEVEAGAEYDHGDWHAIWEKNLTGDLNMDFGTSISVNCENQCGVELEANIKLFGVVGGGIWVLPYGYFDFYNPPFHYEGGVGVKGGAQLMLGICGWELEREFTLAEYEIELFESYQQQNLPPNAPTISGPDSAQVNESVTFTASATDPDGDNVAIRFDWGDGNISSWSSYVSSGQSVSMSHIWTSVGTYYVKAQAKDMNGVTSGWSSAHKIVITGANNSPNAPVVSGPDSAQVNESVTFTASATDPDGDNVAIRFDWGDGNTSNWSSYVSSGQSVSMSHTYTTAGTYYVKAQAKDVNGAVSGWSSAHEIVIYSGQIGWTKTYGGSDDDWGHSVQQTRDGGYIIAGYTLSFGAGGSDYDVYLIKTDAYGNVEWTKTYGGSDLDYGCSVQQTSDGGYIIAGWTFSFGAGEADVYLIKTDAYGNVEWTKTYGGSYYDWGYSVQQTEDGGYIIAGSFSVDGWDFDVYLIKTDAYGNVEWTKTYGGSDDDWGRSVRQTLDGGYIIAGKTESFGADGSDFDVYLIKTDAYGNAEWTKTYGGSNWDYGYSVQQTQDGGYIIAGWTKSFGAGDSDVYLIKTDAYGNVEWTKTYGGSYCDFGESVQQTLDGGYIIAGGTCSFGAGGEDVYLIKTDAYGNVSPKISIRVAQPGGVKSMLRGYQLHMKYGKLRGMR